MSTAPLAALFSFLPMPEAPVNPGAPVHTEVRRRGSYEQGRALETLGHAIEYLTDSRMFFVEDVASRVQAELTAVQILMRASRSVFQECPEVVPIHRQLRRKVGRWIGLGEQTGARIG